MKNCFVISPIGKASSETRIRADKILKHVIKPVCLDLEFKAYRADEINDPGLITKRIIQEIISSELVVADLTEHNPNVFYEFAIRHFTGKPVVQLIEVEDQLPFDVYDINTIRIDHKDIDSIENAKEKLRLYIHSVMIKGKTETPITSALDAVGMSVTSGKNKATVEEQLLELTKNVITELDQSKKERSFLIDKLVDKQESIAINTTQKNECGLTVEGLWNSNNGKILLKQTDDFVVGEYQYGSDEYVGDIMRKVVDDAVLFEWNWKDSSKEGIGFWFIGDQEMNGAWFYKSECDLSLNDLMTDPGIIESLRNTSDHEWHLYKNS